MNECLSVYRNVGCWFGVFLVSWMDGIDGWLAGWLLGIVLSQAFVCCWICFAGGDEWICCW